MSVHRCPTTVGRERKRVVLEREFHGMSIFHSQASVSFKNERSSRPDQSQRQRLYRHRISTITNMFGAVWLQLSLFATVSGDCVNGARNVNAFLIVAWECSLAVNRTAVSSAHFLQCAQ
jgi:hypothetical protein